MARRGVTFALVGLTALLAWLAWFSLRWRPELDSPILLYMAFLIRHGWVPYRDFFDMNCPGAYALYGLLTSLFGFSDLGLRWADLTWLAALAATTVGLLRPLGGRAGWCAATLFGLTYLWLGPAFSLQREFLLLLPLALGLLLARQSQWPGWLRGFLGGLCGGLCVTVKPATILVLPPLIAAAFWQEQSQAARRGSRLATLAAALVGAAVGPALAATYLLASGGGPGFVDIVRHYWPLYTHMTGDHRVIEGAARLRYLASGWSSDLLAFLPWLPLAGVGVLALRPAEAANGRRRLVALLWALAGLSALYPLPAGQFWAYHWLPFQWTLALLAGVACGTQKKGAPGKSGLFAALPAILLVLWAVTLYQPPQSNPQPQGGRPDALARWLVAHAKPGDRVQPLDWTHGGVVQAMLMTRTLPATRFLYSFHFYHHVSRPYLQRLRGQFLSELQAARPRFIVETTVAPPWPQGPDTTREFPALQALLHRDYAPALVGEGFTVWELVPPRVR